MDISTLLSRYQQLAAEASRRDTTNRIEKMLKRHLRELALEGGLDNTPLYTVRNDGGCDEGLIPCLDGSCVPPEVGC